MDDANHHARAVRFGIFETDLQTEELHKNGERVQLQGQPFQVCAILPSRPGDLVTREELRQEVWPEDTFVDFDQALNTAIAKIRTAWGDDAENPRFVETLPRRGYRFIGPVDQPSLQVPTAGVSLWKIQPDGGTPIQVTKNGGVFAVESADGRFLYYSKYETPGIWRIPLNGGEETRILDQPAGESWWNWAVARNGIYFFESSTGSCRWNCSYSGAKSSINFFDFASGKKILLAATDRPSLGLALSPDGTSILYVRHEWMNSSIMLVKNFR